MHKPGAPTHQLGALTIVGLLCLGGVIMGVLMTAALLLAYGGGVR